MSAPRGTRRSASFSSLPPSRSRMHCRMRGPRLPVRRPGRSRPRPRRRRRPLRRPTRPLLPRSRRRRLAADPTHRRGRQPTQRGSSPRALLRPTRSWASCAIMRTQTQQPTPAAALCSLAEDRRLRYTQRVARPRLPMCTDPPPRRTSCLGAQRGSSSHGSLVPVAHERRRLAARRLRP